MEKKKYRYPEQIEIKKQLKKKGITLNIVGRELSITGTRVSQILMGKSELKNRHRKVIRYFLNK